MWAGDGKRYSAVVESCRGTTVTVQWLRRHAAASASEVFVSEVGDDATHEHVPVSEVQLTSAASGARTAAASGAGNLLDLDTPVATATAATSAPAPAASPFPGLDLKAAYAADEAAKAAASQPFQSNFGAFGAIPAAAPAMPAQIPQGWAALGGPAAAGGMGGYGAPMAGAGAGAPMGGAGSMRPAMGAASAGGFGGGYSGMGAPGGPPALGLERHNAAAPKATAQKSAPPAKKDIDVGGDAFALTFGGK